MLLIMIYQREITEVVKALLQAIEGSSMLSKMHLLLELMLEDNKMSKAIDSGMYNIADQLKTTSSTSHSISTFKDKIENLMKK